MNRIHKKVKSIMFLVSNPFNVENLLSVMARVRESVPGDRKGYWYFRDLTSMSIGVPEDELLRFYRRAFRYHKSFGDLALYTMNEQAHSEIFCAKLYQLPDIYLRFLGESTRERIKTSVRVLNGVFNFNSKKAKYIIDEKGQMQLLEE